MTDELVELKKKVRDVLQGVHDFRHPLGDVPEKCWACKLYRECAPKPVDPMNLLRRVLALDISLGGQLRGEIKAALAAHESEGI